MEGSVLAETRLRILAWPSLQSFSSDSPLFAAANSQSSGLGELETGLLLYPILRDL